MRETQKKGTKYHLHSPDNLRYKNWYNYNSKDKWLTAMFYFTAVNHRLAHRLTQIKIQVPKLYTK